MVANGMTLSSGIVIPPAGPAGWFGHAEWLPYRANVPGNFCPSDLNPKGTGNSGHNSYAFSIGDSTGPNWNNDTWAPRGVFANFAPSRGFKDITDGLSNTIGMSERPWPLGNYGITTAAGQKIAGVTAVEPAVTTNPASCLTRAVGTQFVPGTQIKARFGSLYSDGQAERVAFNTVLGPNKVSCVNDANVNADSAGGVLNAGSYHPGGVNALFMDGSVKFISDSINAGNPALPPVAGGISPYGVWGALGSIQGGEPAQSLE